MGQRRISRLASSVTATSVVDRENNQADDSSDDEQGDETEDVRMDAPAQEDRNKTDRRE